MPKATWMKTAKDPPIDILLAVILERKQALNVKNEELAKATGLNMQTISRMLQKSPWTWRGEYREKILNRLNVPASIRMYAYEEYLKTMPN